MTSQKISQGEFQKIKQAYDLLDKYYNDKSSNYLDNEGKELSFRVLIDHNKNAGKFSFIPD